MCHALFSGDDFAAASISPTGGLLEGPSGLGRRPNCTGTPTGPSGSLGDQQGLFEHVPRNLASHEVVSSSVHNAEFHLTPSLPCDEDTEDEAAAVSSCSCKLQNSFPTMPLPVRTDSWASRFLMVVLADTQEHSWTTCQQTMPAGQIMSAGVERRPCVQYWKTCLH